MKNIKLGVVVCILIGCSNLKSIAKQIEQDACLHTLELFDSWGDGWNGAYAKVYSNNYLVLDSITLSSGSFGSFDFKSSDNEEIRFEFYEGGCWCTEECSWIIKDALGDTVLVGEGDYSPSPIVQYGIGKCNYQDIDLAVISVEPSGEIYEGETITPVCLIENKGLNPVGYILVEAEIFNNSGSSFYSSKEVYATIPAGETLSISFDDNWIVELGEYTIRATVTVNGDLMTLNNELNKSIVGIPKGDYASIDGIALNSSLQQVVDFDPTSGDYNTLMDFGNDYSFSACNYNGNWLYAYDASNYLYKIDGDGTIELVKHIVGYYGITVAMSWNPIDENFYTIAIGSDIVNLNIINLETGMTNTIGNLPIRNYMAMEFTYDGRLFALGVDTLYEINLVDFSITAIGETGITTDHFLQDLSWYQGALYSYTRGSRFSFGYYDIHTGTFIELQNFNALENIDALQVFNGPAAYTATVKVIDNSSNIPIEGADIELINKTFITDNLGEFKMNLLPGEYNFGVNTEGYLETTGSINIEDDNVLITVLLIPDEVLEVQASQVFVYPNPVQDKLSIDFGDYKGEYMIELKNSLSQKVIRKPGTAENNSSLDVSNISQGVYFLHIKYQNTEIIRKVIVE